MLYSKLNILTELNANDVKFISVDRQKLDFSKYNTYGAVNSIFVEIQTDYTNIKMTLVSQHPKNPFLYNLTLNFLLKQAEASISLEINAKHFYL